MTEYYNYRDEGFQASDREPDDYGSECSNCGKPMQFRFCGMCWSCEQEYNDIGLEEGIFREPDETGIPNDHLFNGHCPVCGSDNTSTKGGNYTDQAQQDVCHDCGWMGAIEYE